MHGHVNTATAPWSANRGPFPIWRERRNEDGKPSRGQAAHAPGATDPDGRRNLRAGQDSVEDLLLLTWDAHRPAVLLHPGRRQLDLRLLRLPGSDRYLLTDARGDHRIKPADLPVGGGTGRPGPPRCDVAARLTQTITSTTRKKTLNRLNALSDRVLIRLLKQGHVAADECVNKTATRPSPAARGTDAAVTSADAVVIHR